jgi:hypothetical protein
VTEGTAAAGSSAPSSLAQRRTVRRSPVSAAAPAGTGVQMAIARYASTAGSTTSAGIPIARNAPTIPPLAAPGSGTVFATWPRK